MPSEFDFDDSTLIPSEPHEATRDDAARPADAPAGTRFRPTEKLGEGGQGEVWLALDPELGRQVALKVIRRDRLDSDETRGKFQLEAEVTGKLEHPNIVAIYESGRQQLVADDPDAPPAPYYVMRVYRKHTLEKAVEEFHAGPWSEPKLRELLQRFVDVCNAVGHAHSRGVIHRDLKPENVMLGEFGETLLVDWGLAKIVGRDEVHKTADGDGTVQLERDPDATTVGSIKGTPRYMSPEQARGEVATLGPATDVYGLGAILYHLLTGRPPVDKKELTEVLEHVRAGRIDPPRDRNPRVPRALDAVCRKAMSKEPLDRYRTAVELADDVTRWLVDEPVAAYRDPLSTRARRWLRRHQALAASSAVAVLVGLLALSALLVMVRINNDRLADANADLQQANQRESAARREAEENEREANRQKKLAEANERNAEEQSKLAAANAATARQQTQLAIGTLNTVIFDIQRGLENVPGAGEVRRKLLATALERLRQISDEFGDADVVDRQTSVVLSEMADTVLRVGIAEEELEIRGAETQSPVEFALELYRRASEILVRLATADPSNAQAQRDLSVSHNKLGDVLLQSGQMTEALAQYQQMLEISQKLAAADPSDAVAQRDLFFSHIGLGDVLLQSSESTEALGHYETSLEICQNLAAADPTDAKAQRNMSVSYERLGNVRLRTGKLDQALESYRACYEICERLAAADPTNILPRKSLALSLENLGDLSRRKGDLQGALKFFMRKRDIDESQIALDPQNTEFQHMLFVSYAKLGNVLLETGAVHEAIHSYRHALEFSKALAEADSGDVQSQFGLAISYSKLGDALLKDGEAQQALQLYRQCHEITERLAAIDSTDAKAQRDLSLSYLNLGDALLQTGEVGQALESYRSGLEISERLAQADPTDAQAQRDLSVSLTRLGDVLLQTGEVGQALQSYRQCYEIKERLAAAAPSNMQFQRELMAWHIKFGTMKQKLFAYTEADEQFRIAKAVLDRMIKNGYSVEQSRRVKTHLYPRWLYAKHCLIATKEWETVLDAPADDLPMLLNVRGRELAKQGRLDDAADAAAKLRELVPAEKDNLYNAARGYGLCAKAGKVGEPADLTAEQKERRRAFQGLAIVCLQEAIVAGYDDFEKMAKDKDFSAVCDLPEFKALLPADSRGDAGGDGLEAENESPDAS